jgi:hypothetical protein
MLFRGRQPDAAVWRRFRSGTDDFTFAMLDGHYEARVTANAERVVDLLHALCEELPPAVDVSVEDRRTGRAWAGADVALPDARAAVARLKAPLSAYAGVELSIYTVDDQLTLTADLELFVYARTDRWLYILLGKGLVEVPSLPAEAFYIQPEMLAPAPELEAALEMTAEQLGLAPA